jgi:hypothetical protein
MNFGVYPLLLSMCTIIDNGYPCRCTLGCPKKNFVITEKPSSARRIAVALDDNNKPKRAQYGKVGFIFP